VGFHEIILNEPDHNKNKAKTQTKLLISIKRMNEILAGKLTWITFQKIIDMFEETKQKKIENRKLYS
jgi:hypothetical protein